MDAPWRIEMLGWLRAVRGEQIVARFRSQQTGALLAYLAYYRHRSHPREALIELLWPECDLEDGRNRFRVALSSLRRQLEPPGVPPGVVIIADHATVQLNPTACSTDVAEFESALQTAARAGSSRERAHRLSEAVELYRGELLPGYFEEWILPERQRLAGAYLQALQELIALLERAGDLPRALQYARRAVSADTLSEEAHREVMRLLAASGHPEAALRQYQELEWLLDQELGAAPAPEIQALAREIELEANGNQHGDAETRRISERAKRKAVKASSVALPITQDRDHLFGAVPVAAVLPHHSGPPTRPFAPPSLPAGTVTFLLTDVEGSSAFRQRAAEAFTAAVASHHELLRRAFQQHGGHEVKEMDDAFLVAFPRAGDALACAVAAQRVLAAHAWPEAVGALRVRMALHTGDVEPREGDYQGRVLHCAQRVLVAGHGGQILCSEETAGLLRREVAEGVRLVDLGVYRLRDVTTPERLFQVEYPEMGQRSFPPLRAEGGYAGHLPLQFTRFFGREDEMARLREELHPDAVSIPAGAQRAGGARLVTLTGSGGTGKTRLAVAAATELQEAFRGAVWFVPLADLSDPHRIIDKLRDVLRLPRAPGLEPLEEVVAFLARQPALLILDNFEHLLPGGAEVVQRLLERLECLGLLVTSRQRLGLSGERELPVAPLPVPTVASGQWSVASQDGEAGSPLVTDYWSLATVPSVRLFVDRAQAVRPDFRVTERNAAAVAALCQQLEGLPLALELAAARARVLTPAQMLARLEQPFELLTSRQRDVLPHHRSLRAALDWSYQLLSPELRPFFACLSVFRGGFTLEAAEAVCAEPAAMEYLGQLQESSLIVAEETVVGSRETAGTTQEGGEREDQDDRPAAAPLLPGGSALPTTVYRLPSGTEMRYRLLETLRQYGAEQLGPDEQAELARRHAQYYLALVEQAEPKLLGPEQRAWRDRLEPEQDNFRALLAWSVEKGETQFGLRLSGALWWFWTVRGSFSEGRQWLARLLAPGETSPDDHASRAKAQVCAGVLAHFQGDHAAARALYEASLVNGRARGDQWCTAMALIGLGFLAQFQGDNKAARAFLEESLPLWRALDNPWGTAMALNGLADAAVGQGDHAAARALFEQSLQIRRELEDQWGIAVSLNGLGGISLEQGNLESARALFEQGLQIRRELRDQWGIAVSLSNLGHASRLAGDLVSAQSLFKESLRIRRELGDKRGIADCLEGLALVMYLGSGQSAEGMEPVALRTLPAARMAARLGGAAVALREAIGAPLSPAERTEYERHVAALRAALGDAEFAQAWERGRALSWEQAVVEALGGGKER